MFQVQPPRPFFIFRTLEDQIEGLSVSRHEVYAIGRAVQKPGLEQLASFRMTSRKVGRMGLLCDFKSPLHRQDLFGRNGAVGTR